MTEYDSAGEFTQLQDVRDGSLLTIRRIDADRYRVKLVPTSDPSGLAAGTLIYREPSLSTGGAVTGVAPGSSVKPKRKRKRHRKKRVTLV